MRTSVLASVSAILLAASACLAQAAEIKMATLAPKGSAWAKIMEENAKEVSAQTSGRVQLKYYFSGQQGDERDVVRKMKIGQLDGAAVTAVGLGQIKSDVRVLELPLLFKDDKELDYVREKMRGEFEKQFAEAGFVLLAWGDVGWVHMYTANPIQTKADLLKAKMWAWTDDQIVRAMFSKLGVNGVPLGVPDVLPSLQTGLINACYGSPLASVALQWYTKVKFATEKPIAYAIGASIMRKSTFDKLSPEDQKILLEQGRKMGEKLKANVRKDNERARKAMEKSGVKFAPTPPATQAELEKAGLAVWDELAGKVYSKQLLEQVKKNVAEVRK